MGVQHLKGSLEGAIYHISAIARERDRLRQDVLESLGVFGFKEGSRIKAAVEVGITRLESEERALCKGERMQILER